MLGIIDPLFRSVNCNITGLRDVTKTQSHAWAGIVDLRHPVIVSYTSGVRDNTLFLSKLVCDPVIAVKFRWI